MGSLATPGARRNRGQAAAGWPAAGAGRRRASGTPAAAMPVFHAVHQAPAAGARGSQPPGRGLPQPRADRALCRGPTANAHPRRRCCRRHHGGGVPEYWGRDSPYHPGTEFLGTPKNHLEVRRPQPRGRCAAAAACCCRCLLLGARRRACATCGPDAPPPPPRPPRPPACRTCSWRPSARCRRTCLRSRACSRTTSSRWAPSPPSPTAPPAACFPWVRSNGGRSGERGRARGRGQRRGSGGAGRGESRPASGAQPCRAAIMLLPPVLPLS